MIPNTAVHTDIIVGFPGETAEQFQRTYDLLAELKLDKAHLAMYSPRPGTVSERRMVDDVSPEEKKRRWEALDQLQEQVVGEINRRQLGETVEVLVEDLHRGSARAWRPLARPHAPQQARLLRRRGQLARQAGAGAHHLGRSLVNDRRGVAD